MSACPGSMETACRKARPKPLNMASMMWCCMLTGVKPESITWYPEDRILANIPRGQSADTPGIAEKLRQVAVESVQNALATPYDVTQSKITS